MGELTKITPGKALDGTVKPLDGSIDLIRKPARNGTVERDLPRSAKQSSTPSEDSLPQAGQILTGKQEHCGSSFPHASMTSRLTNS